MRGTRRTRAALGMALAAALVAAACQPAAVRFATLSGPLVDAVLTPEELAGVDVVGLPVDVDAVVAGVDPFVLKGHVDALTAAGPRTGATAAAQQAVAYLDARLAAEGYAVQHQPVALGGITMPNVYVTKPGTACPGKVFVVGGHYDSVPGSPGADDNASGTAGMLELARVLADVPLPITVRFAGFAFEESGLVGSGVMAQDLQDRGTDVVGMVSLAMIGFTRTAPDPFIGTNQDFLAVVANPASARLAEVFGAASLAYTPSHFAPAAVVDPATLGDVLRSDHAPFWARGFPALLATDTANFRNPNYHQASDTAATLDVPFLLGSTRSVAAGLVAFATLDADGDGVPDACAG
jgi:acetylornithine deacetylase/succinyl-diaminopimelate desuccinylase-like protein